MGEHANKFKVASAELKILEELHLKLKQEVKERIAGIKHAKRQIIEKKKNVKSYKKLMDIYQ